jgi:hypothetical protein
MSAQTIDQVIEKLSNIVEQTKADASVLGYFAALYRQVTVQVKAGIDDGFFEDGPRMEKLDVVFANRYLGAYEAWQQRQPTTKSWRVAFKQAAVPETIILQHLLLGINAHINLDLGIAAAAIAPGDSIHALKGDFDKINTVLKGLMDPVMDVVSHFSPLIGVLEHIGGKYDDILVGFSLELAREAAWSHALLLAPLPQDQWPTLIDLIDHKAAFLGKTVANPGYLLHMGLKLIKEAESDDVPAIIEALGAIEPVE